MTDSLPTLAKTMIVADDPLLAASVVTMIGHPSEYVPVVEPPRIRRPDAEHEMARLRQAVLRVNPSKLLLAGRNRELWAAIQDAIPEYAITRVASLVTAQAQLANLLNGRPSEAQRVYCRADALAIGLRTARTAGRWLEIKEDAPDIEPFPIESGQPDHCLWIDDPDPLVQLVAAEYSHALGADLRFIESRSPEFTQETYFRLTDRGQTRSPPRRDSAFEFVIAAKGRIEAELGPLPRLFGTFVTSGFPYGYFVPSLATTHLFSGPNLGSHLVGSLYSSSRPPKDVPRALLVDPGKLPDTETAHIASSLGRLGHEVACAPRH